MLNKNESSGMKYLVLGVDSYIGAYIYKHLKQNSLDVIATSKRRNLSNDEYIFFDILKSDIRSFADLYHTDDGLAIFCIANSNIKNCCENYINAYQINVIKTKELISNLIRNGYTVLFFSSDNVFDGIKGNYKENDVRNALNRYGQMKMIIEDYLLEKGNGVVFRISKVISSIASDHNIFKEWELQSKKRQTIKCVRGNILSFISMDDIFQLCMLIKEKELSGLYNVCGNKSYSRKELADIFIKRGQLSAKTEEYALEEFSLVDGRPLNISMDNSTIVKETGFQFTSVEKVIDEYFQNTRGEMLCTY